jgi:putative aldouronate transport system substrate-binding protein
VLNYLASPFGSQEYLNNWYGVKGLDFNFDEKGNPVYTQMGQNNVQYITWQTIISPPAVLYDVFDENFVKVAHPIEMAAHDLAITDPTVGLYAPSLASKGAKLTQDMIDGVNQILFGRADVSSLDGLVKAWRANGGDQIRSEYEDALAKSKA